MARLALYFGIGIAACLFAAASAEAACNPVTDCSGHGVCLPNDTCACNVGFTGASCNQCGTNYYNYPTCTFCLAGTTCSNHGTCTTTGGCSCDTGWTGPACNVATTEVPVASPWARVLLALLLVAVAGVSSRIRATRG
jgi:hypothetical protein